MWPKRARPCGRSLRDRATATCCTAATVTWITVVDSSNHPISVPTRETDKLIKIQFV